MQRVSDPTPPNPNEVSFGQVRALKQKADICLGSYKLDPFDPTQIIYIYIYIYSINTLVIPYNYHRAGWFWAYVYIKQGRFGVSEINPQRFSSGLGQTHAVAVP